MLPRLFVGDTSQEPRPSSSSFVYIQILSFSSDRDESLLDSNERHESPYVGGESPCAIVSIVYGTPRGRHQAGLASLVMSMRSIITGPCL